MSDPNSNDFVPPPPPPQPVSDTIAAETMSTGQTLTGIFFEPGRVFESLRERPRFLAAGIICTIALLAFTTLYYQRVGFERLVTEEINSSPQAEQMTPEQKEQAIRPQVPCMAGRLAAVGVDRRYRVTSLELARDQLRVAVDVGAHLQDRDATIAARQRDEVGLRHHVRLLHGEPGRAFVREELSHFLREG